MDRKSAEALLQTAVDDLEADFRPGQWEAIDALVNHRQKLMVIQRTGWGKSSVYFISTRILRDRGAGPTIIVSPLLALMRNQIEAAERLGIRAVTINSTNRDDWDRATQKVLADQVDAILISPERLSNEEFVDNVLQPVAERIGLLVVDEAHCISDWGHDFRPDYRRLVNILRQMPPNMPLLGTTATANNRVIADVQSQLGDIQIQRGTLVRESLSLQTLRLPDQASRLAWLASHIPELPGTGIVYVLTIRDAEQVA
ncbi:DEAD/DEAH box helicase, partial [Thiolapillus sp.]